MKKITFVLLALVTLAACSSPEVKQPVATDSVEVKVDSGAVAADSCCAADSAKADTLAK